MRSWDELDEEPQPGPSSKSNKKKKEKEYVPLRFTSQYGLTLREVLRQTEFQKSEEEAAFQAALKVNKNAQVSDVIGPGFMKNRRAQLAKEREQVLKDIEAKQAFSSNVSVEIYGQGGPPLMLPPLEKFNKYANATLKIVEETEERAEPKRANNKAGRRDHRDRAATISKPSMVIQNESKRRQEPHIEFRPGHRDLTEDQKRQRALVVEEKLTFFDEKLGIFVDREGNKESSWTEREKLQRLAWIINWVRYASYRNNKELLFERIEEILAETRELGAMNFEIAIYYSL